MRDVQARLLAVLLHVAAAAAEQRSEAQALLQAEAGELSEQVVEIAAPARGRHDGSSADKLSLRSKSDAASHVSMLKPHRRPSSKALDKASSLTTTAAPSAMTKALSHISATLGLGEEPGQALGPPLIIAILLIVILISALAFTFLEADHGFDSGGGGGKSSRRRSVPAARPPRTPSVASGTVTPKRASGAEDAGVAGGPDQTGQFMQIFNPNEGLGLQPSQQSLAARPMSLQSVQSAGPASVMPQSRASPRPSMPATGAAAPALPQICPNLVMPNNEALFTLSFQKLVEGTGPLQVMGLSGHALLRITVSRNAQGKSVSLLMPPARSPTLATVRASPAGLPAEILVGNQGSPFGSIVAAGDRFQMLHGSQQALWFAFDGPTGALNLHAAHDNKLIAKASRSQPDVSGEEIIEVYVHPGVDGVLVLCCVLAVIFNWQN